MKLGVSGGCLLILEIREYIEVQDVQKYCLPTRYKGCELRYDIFVNCNWVVTRWQYTFTHKQYIEQYKTNNI